MKDFNGKNVFITGGSSGIGLAGAKLLAAEGAHVAVFARTKAKLVSALKEIESCRRAPEQRFDFMTLDVSDNRQVKKVLSAAVKKFGVPDILINCAGRAYPRRFEDVSYGQFDDTMKTNLYGIWNTVSVLAPLMKEKGGTIVNTSSVAGVVGVFGYTDYCASKFAIVGFSEALRGELRGSGISVQVLCPPDTDTPGFQVENTTKPEETREISKGAKVMKPEQVAAALLGGIKAGTFLIIPGFDGKLTCFMKRMLPGLVNFVMDRQVEKVRKRKK